MEDVHQRTRGSAANVAARPSKMKTNTTHWSGRTEAPGAFVAGTSVAHKVLFE